MADWVAIYHSGSYSPDDLARDIKRELVGHIKESRALDLPRVMAAIDAGYNPETVFDEQHQTLLMSAAIFGLEEVVDALIRTGADVNARMKNGNTALIYAARAISPGITRKLAAAGADINHADASGNTALYYAVAGGRIDMARALLDRDDAMARITPRTLKNLPTYSDWRMKEYLAPFMAEIENYEYRIANGLPTKRAVKTAPALRIPKRGRS